MLFEACPVAFDALSYVEGLLLSMQKRIFAKAYIVLALPYAAGVLEMQTGHLEKIPGREAPVSFTELFYGCMQLGHLEIIFYRVYKHAV